MKQEIIRILKEVRPDVNFESESKLIDDGILDSFDIIQMVMELNECFDVEIQVEDLQPENFNSIEAMIELITRLQDE